MNALSAASNISSAIGIQSKLLINMCSSRPGQEQEQEQEHGQDEHEPAARQMPK